MFDGIKNLTRAVHGISRAIRLVSLKFDEEPAGTVRLDSLEARLGEVEATLSLKLSEAAADLVLAKSERKVARNAENRTHTLEAKRLERESDLFGDDSEGEEGIEVQYRALLSDGDAAGDASNGVQALHQGMEVPRRLTRSELAYRRLAQAE